MRFRPSGAGCTQSEYQAKKQLSINLLLAVCPVEERPQLAARMWSETSEEGRENMTSALLCITVRLRQLFREENFNGIYVSKVC